MVCAARVTLQTKWVQRGYVRYSGLRSVAPAPQLRCETVDLVVVNNTQSIVVSAVSKHDIATIREWSKSEIYCGGADPLPVKSIVRALQHQTYTEVCEALGTDSMSDEEWVPESESESDY